MATNKAPSETAKCQACFHEFGNHFETYSGRGAGCVAIGDTEDYQYKIGHCGCVGYTYLAPTLYKRKLGT